MNIYLIITKIGGNWIYVHVSIIKCADNLYTTFNKLPLNQTVLNKTKSKTSTKKPTNIIKIVFWYLKKITLKTWQFWSVQAQDDENTCVSFWSYQFGFCLSHSSARVWCFYLIGIIYLVSIIVLSSSGWSSFNMKMPNATSGGSTQILYLKVQCVGGFSGIYWWGWQIATTWNVSWLVFR